MDTPRFAKKIGVVIATIAVGALAAVIPHLVGGGPVREGAPVTMGPAVGMPGAPPTSSSGLSQRVSEMEARLRAQPGDVAAAVLLADALLRQARAANDVRAAGRAGEVLKGVLNENPAQYEALRLLGAIDLSQHRFRDALEVARRARDLRPDDAWNYGVMGDAQIELGDYEQAYDAFEKMMALRPSAAAYARVAYARELRGDVTGALQAMQMAAQATAPQDPEAQAWYAAQTGELNLKLGRIEDAERDFRYGTFVFPRYPLAMIGQGKVKAAHGDFDGALTIYLDQLTRTPTLDLAARVGDLYARRGDAAQAERYYQMAEDVAGPGMVQTEGNLALFLADHDRKLPDAVTIAEAVSKTRRDIFTEDALAWAYYKAGRLDDALAASQLALRTGTRDEVLLSRAARIRTAAGS
jgi:tetratricopeptide (TPR) repeat protein